MDLIENGVEPPATEDTANDLTWGHPSTLAIASLLLAFLSVMGASVFRGVAYTMSFADTRDLLGNGDDSSGTGFAVAGAFLTAAFALLPMLLALQGLRKAVPTDGTWTPHVLRAAFLLALVSLTLHLVLAVIAATSDQPFAGLFSSIWG